MVRLHERSGDGARKEPMSRRGMWIERLTKLRPRGVEVKESRYPVETSQPKPTAGIPWRTVPNPWNARRGQVTHRSNPNARSANTLEKAIRVISPKGHAMQDRELKLARGVPVLVALALGLALLIVLCVVAIQREERWMLWIIVPYTLLFVFACLGFL